MKIRFHVKNRNFHIKFNRKCYKNKFADCRFIELYAEALGVDLRL